MSRDGNITKPLKEWLVEFHDDTGKISELSRNLAFAAIGIIWIFQSSDLTTNIIPRELVPPLKYVVIALASDLTQYVWKAFNVFIIYQYKEYKYDEGQLAEGDIADVKVPNYIQIGTWLLFICKIICISLAYFKIYQFLSLRI